jgi:hypothetical protein
VPRSSWNANSPDIAGVEFLGVGVASNIVQVDTRPYAVKFTAQRTGLLDTVAIWSGPLTNNPVRSYPHFAGHRQPFICDLYPVSGFDLLGPLQSEFYAGRLIGFANVIDDDGSAPDGDELVASQDGKFLFPAAVGTPLMTCDYPSIAAFQTDRHVIDLQINLSVFTNATVKRADQNGLSLWARSLPNGNFSMSEIRIESSTTGPYVAWTPLELRQFDSGTGFRRMQIEGIAGQGNVFDQLGLTIHFVPEQRAGTAIVEPLGSWQWTTAGLVQPGTAIPATVAAGGEYILLLRCPGGQEDFGAPALWDVATVRDKKPGSSFVHFGDLSWHSHAVTMYGPSAQQQLGDLLDGLPPVRLISANAQTVDTQPYEFTVGVVPFKSTEVTNRAKQRLSVPAGTTNYSGVRVTTAVFDAPGAPEDKRHVDVTLVNDLGGVIAGPFQLTEAMYQASPVAGSDIFNDPYRTVTVPFGAGIDINETNGVTAEFVLASDYAGNDTWRIGALYSALPPVTGSDQTAVVSGNGKAFIPPTNVFRNIATPGVSRGDLEVSLLSQPPAIPTIGVTGLSQPVSGGPCEPCDAAIEANCMATEIPYNQVVWPATTLNQEKFGYYELQRRESAVSDDWVTIAIITPTGAPVTGVPATGVPHFFDDWTHVFDTEVCYRVRQQRTDGTLSDFVAQTCITRTSPAGTNMVITAQSDPSLNVAFAETYGGDLPIEREWTNLDVDQTVLRPIYGRDKFLVFKPSERLGLQWQRRLLVSALCTPELPCMDVVAGIRAITSAPVDLVVRDNCGNRWYADVAAPKIMQLTDPSVGDQWLVDVTVTEVATPIITAET